MIKFPTKSSQLALKKIWNKREINSTMKRYKSTEAILFERSSFSSVDFSINPHIIDKPTYTHTSTLIWSPLPSLADFPPRFPSGVDFNLKRPTTIIRGQNCVSTSICLRDLSMFGFIGCFKVVRRKDSLF